MKKCPNCNRELKDDSRFCDYCATPVINDKEQKVLDKESLLKWVLVSIIISVSIVLITTGMGFPVLFGGLFLPLLWKPKRRKE